MFCPGEEIFKLAINPDRGAVAVLLNNGKQQKQVLLSDWLTYCWSLLGNCVWYTGDIHLMFVQWINNASEMRMNSASPIIIFIF